MKKLITLVLSIALAFCLTVTAFAADTTATLSGVPTTLQKDATATITVELSGTPTLSSALVQVTLGEGLELVSGEWKQDGFMKDFGAANGYGVFALDKAGTLDGTVFSFVVKGTTVSKVAQNVKVDFTFKNGSAAAGTATVSKTVKVICKDHTYGEWTVNKAATCTAKGQQTRVCSVCDEVETKSIAAKGHAWGEWTVVKEATCTEDGEKTRTCATCKQKATEKIAAEGHKYSDPVVTKEATETEEGLKTQTCSACGDVKEETIPVLPSTDTNSSEPSDVDDGNSDGFLWVIIALIAVAIVVVVLLFLKKRR